MVERETPTAVRRVAEFYEAWHAADAAAGHDTQAAEWRERRRRLPGQPPH